MSWINLGEVHYVLRRLHGEDAATETVRDLRDVVDARLPDEPFVINAARIKADHPMAYAGAFARPSASPSTPPSGPATPNSSSTDRRGAGGTSGPEGAARSTFTFFALE